MRHYILQYINHQIEKKIILGDGNQDPWSKSKVCFDNSINNTVLIKKNLREQTVTGAPTPVSILVWV